jgi:hypothetical protein
VETSGVRVGMDDLADLHERGGLGGARSRTDADDHGHLQPESTNRRGSYEHWSEIRLQGHGKLRGRRRPGRQVHAGGVHARPLRVAGGSGAQHRGHRVDRHHGAYPCCPRLVTRFTATAITTVPNR